MTFDSYSTVRVNVTALVLDGVDPDDTPDDIAISASLTLTPMIESGMVLQYNDNGVKKLKALTEMTVDIGPTGDITHRNKSYVKIVAADPVTTNIEQLQYRARFNNVRIGAQPAIISDIYFWAVAGDQINLADHVDLGSPSNSVIITRGERGLSVSPEVEIVGGALIFELEDGTDFPPVVVPALTQASEDAAAAHADRLAADAAKAGAETAATTAVTAKDDAEDARDVALAAKADTADDALATAADRTATEDARDIAVAAKGEAEVDAAAVALDRLAVGSAKTDTLAARDEASDFATVATTQADIATTAAGGAQASETAALTQADRAEAQAIRAEQAADDIAEGVVPDGGVSTVKLQDGAVTKAKTSAGVQVSLDKADTSVQEGDARLTNARTPTAHVHAEADVTGLTAKLATKADVDSNGFLVQSQIPAVAIREFLGSVATQAAMLALVGQKGDWCSRSDRGSDFQIIGNDPTQLSSWRENTYPASPVSSVHGRQGAVTTQAVDITDSTTVGRGVLKAADAEAGRTAIGAASSTDARFTDTRTPTVGTVPYDITFVAQSGTRTVGLGDVPAGIKLRRAVTFSEVTFHCETADATGNLVAEIRKNGIQVAGSPATIAAANQVAGGTSSGAFTFAAGDALTINVTGVGTTPGKGLIAELKGVC
ncbi:hypothetical protein [Rhodococcus sp. ARP2]|uniref:hypothetical protein n=1 Tax=Rhodococcus sp. ARP2 TaxID=1661385 RepID=UPI00069F05C9|nr:hypothetical protein [Rhodococcus sp. ARP2]